MKEEQNDIEKLIAKSLAAETSSIEESQLSDWLKKDAENQLVFDKSKKAFDLAKNHKSDNANLSIDVNAEWNEFKNKVEGQSKTIEMVTSPNSMWYKIAASFLILVVSGAILYLSLIRNDETIYQTAETSEVFTLPDSSTVTLNKNSTLAYAKEFGATDRKVKLTGEAFFEVTPNKNKPFIISTDKAQVRVLGTSFNVNTVDENSTEVTVATGVVSFTSTASKKSVTLNAGDQGLLSHDNDNLTSAQNEDVNFLAWKTRTLIFKAATLNEVIETLNHVYSQQFNLSENVGNNCEVTVTFENQTVDAVLNVLESTLDLTVEHEEDQVNITNAGC